MKNIFYCFLLVLAGPSLWAQEMTTPIPVNINTEFIEFSPTVSGDGRTMVFQSNREGGFRLYESTLQPDGNWSPAKAIDNINKYARPDYLIGGPCLSQDGKTLYLCMMLHHSGTDMDIYVSKKNNKNEWGLPLNIGRPVTTANSETFPSISPDGKKLFYTSTPTQGKDQKCPKIMMSELDEKNNWKTPVEVAAPLNMNCDKAPRLVYDHKTLLFASNKNGNYDIFRSEFSGENSWSQPVALDYLNTQEPENSAALPYTEDFIYFSRKGDIYYSPLQDQHRLHGLGFEGKLADAETGKSVSGQLFLVDTLANDTLRRMKVSGTYKINIPAGRNYALIAVAPGYYDYVANYLPSLGEAYKKETADIKIKPKKREVVFNVSGKDNNKGLKVKIKVTNTETKEETLIDAGTGRDGKYAVSLREGNKYNVEISSIEGYAFSATTIEVPVSGSGTSGMLYASGETSSSGNGVSGNKEVGNGDVSDAFRTPNFDIQLQPLRDNTKLALNHIQFLFNQYQLEPESYAELDRVVSLMKTNPSAIVEISAHTDDIGSDDFNNALSAKRAQEIVRYLKTKGIPSSRLKAQGYGKTRPLDTADTEEARAKNRRVELKILDIK